jgi:hypothetical protein
MASIAHRDCALPDRYSVQCGTADIDLRSGGSRPARAPRNPSPTGTGTDAIAGHTYLPMKNKELSKMLSYRGMNVVKVADQIFSGRVAVTLVLLG